MTSSGEAAPRLQQTPLHPLPLHIPGAQVFVPREVALRKYSSSFQGFGDRELGIGIGTLSSPAEGEACEGLAGDGGGGEEGWGGGGYWMSGGWQE